MNRTLDHMIERAQTICVLGHINPDGDCVGSTLALYNYIHRTDPAKKVTVYLEEPSSKFAFLPGFEKIVSGNEVKKSYDLCIVADCADTARIGRFVNFLEAAKESFLIDHHFTNKGFCDAGVIDPESSSTCELLYGLLKKDRIDADIARCLYTGIIHDTGVFKHSCTSPKTMRVAAKCMKFGFDFGKIIDDSFYSMNIAQKKLMGVMFQDLKLACEGKFVYGKLNIRTMKEYGVTSGKDTDGFIDNIRTTDGTVAAGFFYELPDGTYRGSLRSSTDQVNVAEIAQTFGGGGHKRAAGFFLGKDIEKEIDKVIGMVEEQLTK